VLKQVLDGCSDLQSLEEDVQMKMGCFIIKKN